MKLGESECATGTAPKLVESEMGHRRGVRQAEGPKGGSEEG